MGTRVFIAIIYLVFFFISSSPSWPPVSLESHYESENCGGGGRSRAGVIMPFSSWATRHGEIRFVQHLPPRRWPRRLRNGCPYKDMLKSAYFITSLSLPWNRQYTHCRSWHLSVVRARVYNVPERILKWNHFWHASRENKKNTQTATMRDSQVRKIFDFLRTLKNGTLAREKGKYRF